MQSSRFWPVFSNPMDRPVTRSLSLLFILQTLIRNFSFVSKKADLEKIFIHLDRLHFYSEILMEASSLKESSLLATLITSKMVVWKKMELSYPLDETLGQLMEQLCRFFSALKPFLKEGRSDENVLTYLIENRETLNQYLGKNHIEETLQDFFPIGFDQLHAIIYEGYTRRGFNAFFSKIEPLLDAIQWDPSCRSHNRS